MKIHSRLHQSETEGRHGPISNKVMIASNSRKNKFKKKKK